MKILIDCFGCDNPEDFISGIPAAISESPEATLVVAGDKARIEKLLEGKDFDRDRLEFIDAPDIITNQDSPVMAIRRKTSSSLVQGYRALRDRDDLPIMITAGNTGAIIAGSVLILGREDRDIQPTLVTFIPNDKGETTCLTDCGANVDCRPEHLVKFARYASDYMRTVYGKPSPRVALLSVGTEDEKGNAQSKETFALLRESGLNFVGNMEAKSALSGDFEVIVADGFSGNVLLKSIEGTTKSIVKLMAGLIKKHAGEGADLSYLKSAIGELNCTLDFNTMGGAVILGAKKPVIKAHGSANADTLVNTVKQALKIVNTKKSIQ